MTDKFCVSFTSVLLWSTLAVIYILLLKLYRIITRQRQYAKITDVIPGPPGHAIFGNTFDFCGPNDEILKKYSKMINAFPNSPIIRLWFGNEWFLILKEAKAIQEILSSMKHTTKSDDYNLFHSWLGHGLLTSTGQKWHSHRKMLKTCLYYQFFEDYNKVFNEQANILIEKLHNVAGNNSFDIYNIISLCALDIICETMMSKKLGTQHKGESDYIEAVNGLTDIIQTRQFHPLLYLQTFFNMSSLRQKEKSYLNTINSFARMLIHDWNKLKQQSGENENANFSEKKFRKFMDLLLLPSDDGERFTDEEILHEINVFMFGGYDTTATSITWTIYLLGRHPDVQKQLHDEIDMVMGNSSQSVTPGHLTKMRYLEAVIKESLRLYPPAAVLGRKINKDITAGGYHIPAETNVCIDVYHIHRDPSVFPYPEKFDPSRFLKECNKMRDSLGYIPFSAGPRNCVGQKFAMMEEKVILTKIIQNFNIISHQNPKDMKVLLSPILRPIDGVYICLIKRK